MKKDKKALEDDLRPEYELADLKNRVRGKYFDRMRSHTNVALLEPEVRAAFPTDEEVNQALRQLIEASKTLSRSDASDEEWIREWKSLAARFEATATTDQSAVDILSGMRR